MQQQGSSLAELLDEAPNGTQAARCSPSLCHDQLRENSNSRHTYEYTYQSTGRRGARLLVWLILNDRVQPSFIAGVSPSGRAIHIELTLSDTPFDPWIATTPAINEGCTRSLRISHTNRRAPLPKTLVPCTPYRPPNRTGVDAYVMGCSYVEATNHCMLGLGGQRAGESCS